MSAKKQTRFSLNEIDNSQCIRNCNKEARLKITYEGLCYKANSMYDDLKVRCVGPWSYKKIYSLTQYFSAFAIAMEKKWNSINYIEICSGPGRCINRADGKEFNGTPLSIIETEGFKAINRAYFFDYNQEVVDSLNSRFKQTGIQNKAIAFIGDYKTSNILDSIKVNIPNDGLSLVFIDPTDMSISFDFIMQLKKYLKNIDLIINVAVGTDFNRNIKNIISRPESYQNVYNKYVTFLGSNDYFLNTQLLELAEHGKDIELRTLFREAYQKNLKLLGFNFFDTVKVFQYYDILYASGSKAGIDLWRNVHRIDYNGQRELNF